eukprot:jgi/Tetstr1/464223/TSEL_009028.t1
MSNPKGMAARNGFRMSSGPLKVAVPHGLQLTLQLCKPGRLPKSHPHHFRVVRLCFRCEAPGPLEGCELVVYISTPLFRHGLNIRARWFLATALWLVGFELEGVHDPRAAMYGYVMAAFRADGFAAPASPPPGCPRAVSLDASRPAAPIANDFEALAAALGLWTRDSADESSGMVRRTADERSRSLTANIVTADMRVGSNQWGDPEAENGIAGAVVRATHPDCEFSPWTCLLCLDGPKGEHDECPHCRVQFHADCAAMMLLHDRACASCRKPIVGGSDEDEDDYGTDYGTDYDYDYYTDFDYDTDYDTDTDDGTDDDAEPEPEPEHVTREIIEASGYRLGSVFVERWGPHNFVTETLLAAATAVCEARPCTMDEIADYLLGKGCLALPAIAANPSDLAADVERYLASDDV